MRPNYELPHNDQISYLKVLLIDDDDNSVSEVINYMRDERVSIPVRCREHSFRSHFQTSYESHGASYSVGTIGFSLG